MILPLGLCLWPFTPHLHRTPQIKPTSLVWVEYLGIQYELWISHSAVCIYIDWKYWLGWLSGSCSNMLFEQQASGPCPKTWTRWSSNKITKKEKKIKRWIVAKLDMAIVLWALHFHVTGVWGTSERRKKDRGNRARSILQLLRHFMIWTEKKDMKKTKYIISSIFFPFSQGTWFTIWSWFGSIWATSSFFCWWATS